MLQTLPSGSFGEEGLSVSFPRPQQGGFANDVARNPRPSSAISSVAQLADQWSRLVQQREQSRSQENFVAACLSDVASRALKLEEARASASSGQGDKKDDRRRGDHFSKEEWRNLPDSVKASIGKMGKTRRRRHRRNRRKQKEQESTGRSRSRGSRQSSPRKQEQESTESSSSKFSAAYSVVSRLKVFVENGQHVIPVTGLERVRDIQQKVSERFGMQVYGIKRDNDLLHPNCKIKKRLQDGDQVEALTDGEYFDMVYSSRRNLIRPKGKRKAWNPGRK